MRTSGAAPGRLDVLPAGCPIGVDCAPNCFQKSGQGSPQLIDAGDPGFEKRRGACAEIFGAKQCEQGGLKLLGAPFGVVIAMFQGDQNGVVSRNGGIELFNVRS